MGFPGVSVFCRPARLEPCVQIAGMGRDRALMLDAVRTAHWQTERLFPPLYGANAFTKVLRDVFPASKYRGNIRIMVCHSVSSTCVWFVIML